MKRILFAALAFASCASEPASHPSLQPIVLTGEITRADHQTYREIPFTVPPGTQSITIDFSYTGKENRAVIDIGVRDPQGQRGWSGGNKSHIEIGAQSATPSYRAGPIQPGEWTLVLGIPNIRERQTAVYTATIAFDAQPAARSRDPAGPPRLDKTLAAGPAWYRGDFHTHTAHSDGSCDLIAAASASSNPPSARGPCPAIHTFDAARKAGLDFVAVTDHNTITQLADIARDQNRYPDTLLIPGAEITTFNGHANVIGNADFLDFQLGSPRLPTLAKLFDQVEAQDAFLSINHPSLPSGEACMGCGWTVKDTDWSRVTAIEVINGASMRTSGPEGAFNGIAFWEKLLREGHRITAIAGSDNHDATDTTGARQSPVGTPATVVYASELSVQGIIAGVKSGRVFVDVAGLPDARLDVEAHAGVRQARMGGGLTLGSGEDACLTVDVVLTSHPTRIAIVTNGLVSMEPQTPCGPALSFQLTMEEEAAFGWAYATVRDLDGKLLLLGNPIYFRRAG